MLCFLSRFGSVHTERIRMQNMSDVTCLNSPHRLFLLNLVVLDNFWRLQKRFLARLLNSKETLPGCLLTLCGWSPTCDVMYMYILHNWDPKWYQAVSQILPPHACPERTQRCRVLRLSHPPGPLSGEDKGPCTLFVSNFYKNIRRSKHTLCLSTQWRL